MILRLIYIFSRICVVWLRSALCIPHRGWRSRYNEIWNVITRFTFMLQNPIHHFRYVSVNVSVERKVVRSRRVGTHRMIESPPTDVPRGSPDAPSTNSVLNILRRALRFCKYDTIRQSDDTIIGKPVLKIWIFRSYFYAFCCQTWNDGETGKIFLLARKNSCKVKSSEQISQS